MDCDVFQKETLLIYTRKSSEVGLCALFLFLEGGRSKMESVVCQHPEFVGIIQFVVLKAVP